MTPHDMGEGGYRRHGSDPNGKEREVESEVVRGIGLIVVLGVGLQWVARRFGLPSIVLLLAGGLVVGPGFDAVDPDLIFRDSLFPIVSLAVGLLLFNGGLDLDLAALRRGSRGPVVRLVTIGAAVTWVLSSVAAHLLFHEPVRVSVLIGAILVVSGPTVVGPLLRLVRPTEPDATILRWEGILIDPIGATLALFCLNTFFIDGFTLRAVWSELVAVAVAGALAGAAAAAVLVVSLRRMIVPNDLEVAVALMFVVAAYTVAEAVRPEAGLFATTVMGLVLANQRWAPIDQIRAFGEPVVALLIGSLFIVLAADVEAGALRDHLLGGLVLAAALALLVRPLAVALATAGSSLRGRDRAFLACMAPRGVVAASTAALFSLRLEDIGQASEVLTPVVFAVILVLAVLYGLGSIRAARLLGVARPPARGALVLSGAPWALGLARELAAAGFTAVVAARGRSDLVRDDVPYSVYTGLVFDLPGSGVLDDVRRAVIASRDDETDLFAFGLLADALGPGNVWVLPSRTEPAGGRGVRSPASRARAALLESRARRPFGPEVTHELLTRVMHEGGRVRTVAADTVPPGAHVLVRVQGSDWTAAVAPAGGPGERLIVLEPVPARTVNR
jgi:NhaP-type Na+/H+ or K+/H+ antiporter